MVLDGDEGHCKVTHSSSIEYSTVQYSTVGLAATVTVTVAAISQSLSPDYRGCKPVYHR